MVERITHETLAAKMFLDRSSNSTAQGHSDDRPVGLKLECVRSRKKKEERELMYGQQPISSVTGGLSASGKTTLAGELDKMLLDAGKKCVLLDGQEIDGDTGRYDAADQGELVSFPGVTFSYESPKDADLHVSTENKSPQEIARKVLILLALRFGSTLWRDNIEHT